MIYRRKNTQEKPLWTKQCGRYGKPLGQWMMVCALAIIVFCVPFWVWAAVLGVILAVIGFVLWRFC